MRRVIVISGGFACITCCLAFVTFTNLKCGFVNATMGYYEKCQIKAVNRTHKYITMIGRHRNKPVDNITVNIKLKRFDGSSYKPYFIDLTFDACKFLKNQNNAIIKLFYDPIKKTSNLNHSCPYNHDLIVDKLWTGNYEDAFLKYLPMVYGDFAIFTKIFSNNIPLDYIHVYVKLVD